MNHRPFVSWISPLLTPRCILINMIIASYIPATIRIHKANGSNMGGVLSS
jgi:hypothetical protein